MFCLNKKKPHGKLVVSATLVTVFVIEHKLSQNTILLVKHENAKLKY